MRVASSGVCVAVNWNEEFTNKDSNQFKFTGATVVILNLGRAIHAQDFILNTDAEIKNAWRDTRPSWLQEKRPFLLNLLEVIIHAERRIKK